MFNKLFGSASIIGASFFIGKSLTDKLKKRADTLHSFHSSLVMLESEITFSSNSIDRALKNISGTIKIPGFFEYVISQSRDNGIRKAWNSGISRFKDSLCLTNEDAKILQTLSAELGITDKANQIKNIHYVLTLIKAAEADAEEKYRSLSGLYRNISMSAGLVFVILLM